jgi:plastocyanin
MEHSMDSDAHRAVSRLCGNSSPTSPTATNPVDTTTIMITSAGAVTPNTIRVVVGSRVTMMNNDSRVHDMNSNPHPAHTDCPALNWGNIQPGQSVESAALTAARTCGYHDHSSPTNSALQGTIQIQ